jgi:hypothetical protein
MKVIGLIVGLVLFAGAVQAQETMPAELAAVCSKDKQACAKALEIVSQLKAQAGGGDPGNMNFVVALGGTVSSLMSTRPVRTALARW